ncbi:MAG: GH36-type glycosyl hydrolase domain-containing protein [Promethearchaeota archaeon]
MSYGNFSSDEKEYVITKPDTPTPWINYLSNSNYCAMISNTGGGYSFHIDPRDRRILRYRYNNIPMDRPGRYIYIRDNQTSEFWSPTWQPILMNLDEYQCRHGLGYTIIKSRYKGVNTKITYFVPLTDDLEIWMFTIKNNTDGHKDFSIFSYAEFCLWRALGDQNDLQYIQNVAVANYDENGIFYSLFDLSTKFAFFASNSNITGYDCDREAFVGPYHSEANPIRVEKGKCSNSHALGGNPIAATSSDITLIPQEEKTIIYLLGVAKEKKEGKELIRKYSSQEMVHIEFQKLKTYWKNYLEAFQANTPDKNFNLMLNVWNPYQCKITFDWSRYVSFYETGIGRGMGFRDSNQDAMAIAHVLPKRVRMRLLDLTQNQFESGKVYHVFFPLTRKGSFPEYINKDRLFFSDDHLWLILAVSDYIKESGDMSILDEEIPYIEGSMASVYDHLKQALVFTQNNLGNHKLPLIGTADWNDTLSLPGPNNASESVWVGMQFHKALLSMSEIAERYNQIDDAISFRRTSQRLKDNINKVAWDGRWYIRAFTDTGEPVGSAKCEEGQIFLNSQTWAIISGIASNDRAHLAMDAVREYLNTDYGIKLFTPGYTRFYPKLGGITTFPPGLKENASIFCHTNPWAIIAESILGRADFAYEYWQKIAPTTKNNISHIHFTEPYVYSQMITSPDHPKFGMAKNSWLTGTAAWSLKAALEWILGIRPTFDNLIVDPCIPKEWKNFKLSRRFRNTSYKIEVINPKMVSKGIKEIKVDKKTIENQQIPAFGDNKIHNVSVLMG